MHDSDRLQMFEPGEILEEAGYIQRTDSLLTCDFCGVKRCHPNVQVITGNQDNKPCPGGVIRWILIIINLIDYIITPLVL